MRSLALTPAFFVVALANAETSAPASLEDWWAEQPIEALIDSLPPVGEETTRYPYEIESELIHDPVALEFARRIEACEELTGEQWYRALIKTHAIRLPKLWRSGERFAIGMCVPAWLPRTQLMLTSKRSPRPLDQAYGGSNPSFVGCGKSMRGFARIQAYREVGLLPPGTHVLEFDLSFVVGTSKPRALDVVSFVTSFSHTVTVSSDVAEVPEAWKDENLDGALRRSLRLTALPIEDHSSRWYSLILDPRGEDRERLEHVALSLDLQLRREGELIYERPWNPLPLPRGSRADHLQLGLGGCFLDPLNVIDFEQPGSGADWELYVTGTRRYVEEEWDTEVIWRGSVHLDAAKLRRQELELPIPDRRPILWFVWHAWS